MNSTQQWQSVTWFEVDEHQAGQRIDNFLFSRLKGVPKSRIYRLIRESQVRVNKKRVKAETKLNIGDQVRVAPIRYEQKDESAVPVSDKVAQSLLSRVVYEDEGLMVVNKPSGIAVHGGSGVAYGLIEGLRAATGKKYLELVHRIDRDTSGLVMISKKRSVLRTLQDLLREHKIKKTYAAVVKGKVALDKQLINAPLHRYELANGERRVCVSPKEGKESKTQWNVEERFMHATLVYAQPLSGRTHQIRVHGLSIGHPLVGDDKYGHETDYKGPKPRRLCLHAMRLDIPGYPAIEAPLPEDMQSLVAQLRAQKADKPAAPSED
ncbi:MULTISPECIES: RluA family pseudouridine synthase [Acinetobacter]|jgi:23S rRNA pseudouridine955/2504/2580 synthase|uniref:Pseudouridine synthase n=1 Tax=Acinetobacter entericus TaxID=2989714 RepID=A0ABT3NJ56_9GAMM|nr:MULTISPECIES: RluA family pseudouridine synthase [Acinetobacter]MCW8039580.1 RluA family pseudouridine synthase [Acinetobacter entericus]QXW25706.1 RluA family pseudouridine synthase [Acinetobacter johnsonii]TCB74954.1 RluA family pseudouridine synthase [Acinetobacter sp. ANC 4177]